MNPPNNGHHGEDIRPNCPRCDDNSEYRDFNDYRISKYLLERRTPATDHIVTVFNPSQATLLFWYKCIFHDVTLADCAEFLFLAGGLAVSRATICRKLLQMGFTHKEMRYRTLHIDLDDRVLFWTRTPDDPVRPGVYGVQYNDVVDLDESGFWFNAVLRRTGHALLGLPSDSYGPAPRTGPHFSTLIAVDCRVGCNQKHVISRWNNLDSFFLLLLSECLFLH
jgi:hypothetical protein